MGLNLNLEREVSFPEYYNITEADLKQIKDELIQLTEADNKLTIFQRIGFVLDQFTKLLKGTYEFRFKEFNFLNKELNYPFYFSSISITLIFKKGYIAKIYPFVYFVINYYYILSLLITSTIS